MAFGANAFKGAMGAPPPPEPMGKPAGGGLDIEALMGAPGGENGPEDIEGPGGEAGETSLQQALEQAGYQVDTDKLNQIKAILGDAGAAVPEMGGDMGEDTGLGAPPPPAPKATSKIGKLFGK
jgi:hypothetical protein